MEGLILDTHVGSLRKSHPEAFPWVKREGKAARVIATLEALAMLLAVRSFFPKGQADRRTKLAVIPSYTDNRGNGSLLNKLMSSKDLLSALLLKFSEQLRHSGVRPDVRWDAARGEL